MTSAMVQEHLERARQREHPVAEWKRLHDEDGLTYAAIAAQYHVGCSTVKDWCRGYERRRNQSSEQRLEAFHDMIRASKHLSRCERCGIILERSGCIGHANDRPDAHYCWACRDDYPKLCRGANEPS